MSRPAQPKPQYVDVSYGWQDREAGKYLQSRARRWRWLMVVGLLAASALVWLLLWLN